MSSTNDWTHDVYLSVRGSEFCIRDYQRAWFNFTKHLYDSFGQKGIRFFVQDVDLQRGNEITPDLLNEIQKSRIVIIIFSKYYDFSDFCLDELVNILHYVRQGRFVLPVYYGTVNPSVWFRFGEPVMIKEAEKVNKWREALHAVANLSGLHYQRGYQSEDQFVSGIVEQVWKKINRPLLYVADHPVGLQSPVQEVISLLKLGSGEVVNMVGIYGIGGVGKTTIARAVSNAIGDQFEGVCFLADIREKSIDNHGLIQLQEMLLSELAEENNIRLQDAHRRISTIKRRLCWKKVLLILDDVDTLEQLRAIAGGTHWFGRGSRIIITTRKKRMLIAHGVEKLYEVKELNADESLELLSWNAFKDNQVEPDYIGVANRVVLYAGGLPLVLVGIGSKLVGKRKEICNHLLERYEKIPRKYIQQILKISDDSFIDEWNNDVLLNFGKRKGINYQLDRCGRIPHRDVQQILKISDDSFIDEWDYDVFLSFRGEDTRNNFTGHLYNTLKLKGINIFFDGVNLQRGKEITPSLVNAIQESRIAIVVFSENYASSTFCLDELVNILEYVKGEGRFVWPIFYGVDPSEVRHQRGSYGKALEKHEDRFQANKEKVSKWRKALFKAANLSGFHYKQGSQPEYEFINVIIEEVSKKMNHVASN